MFYFPASSNVSNNICGPAPLSKGKSCSTSSLRAASPRCESAAACKVGRLWKALLLCLMSTALIGTLMAGTTAKYLIPKAPIRVKGSFVIAVICKDGIIVASDSRGTVKDRQGKRIAYYDINQKIFPLGSKLIADTGYASLNDPKISFLSALMSRFAESPLSQVEVTQLPDSYFRFAAATLPPAGAESAKVQTLVFAGFQKKKATLCLYQGESNHTVQCSSSGYLSSPKQHIRELNDAKSMSFREAARIMQKTIDDYAAAVQPGFVGGPVVFRTITLSGSKWFGAHPDWPNWGTFTDLAGDYEKNRVPFHLMPGTTRAQLDTLIDEGAAWARTAQSANATAASPGELPAIGFSPSVP